jgi:DNA (cytosine-5)-methyltransferase 1
LSNMSELSKSLTAIDLFSGAGGFTLAALNVGFRVLAAIENSRHACDTYRANFLIDKPKAPILYEEDILRLEPSKVLAEVNILPGDCDIVMGGPPCQGFSVHRIKNQGVDDPRNTLLLKYFYFVGILRPKVFVVENVPGMLWKRHKKYLKRFYKLAKEEGYNVFAPVVLNAKDFGVPQNRKRVFILGVRDDIKWAGDWPPKATHFNPHSNEVMENGQPSWKTAAAVFQAAFPKNDPNAIHMNHTAELVEVFRSTPINGGSRNQSNRNLPCHNGHDGHKDVYGRINPALPAPTMTTACINPSKGRFVHPTKHHGITVRHAARIQTFPDAFIFEGGLMAAGQQVGNAVPILLGEAVLKSIERNLTMRLDNSLKSSCISAKF